MGKVYVADFETTTNPQDCRVWAYAICDIEEPEKVILGTTIDGFMEWCEEQTDNPLVMFHNLRFDAHMIMDYLFRNNFKHVHEKKDRTSGTFSTLIGDTGQFYQLEVIFKKKGKRVQKITFRDSYKLIPIKVEEIPRNFGLEEQKLKLDYDCHNNLPKGTPLTQHEKDYVSHDVIIVAKAVKFFYDQGMDKMTIGACALDEYKKLVGKKNFQHWFPQLSLAYDVDVRQSYRGGFTWVNPEIAGKDIKEGICIDVNSLYPSQMRSHDNPYPFGVPVFYEGEYKPDPIYPLFIQTFRCQFEIKPHRIPTIQIKHSIFADNEYLSSSNGETVTLCLTSVDYELFLQQYNVYNPEYLGGWKYRATVGLFDAYIDKWTEAKIKAGKEGKKGLRQVAKLYLNSLYGKTASRLFGTEKIPFFDDEDDCIKYRFGEPEQRKGWYIACGSFVTSYARRLTITTGQKMLDDYYAGKSQIYPCYADTDSWKCASPGFKLPEGVDIDPYRLGAWDYEGKWSDVGQKPGQGARFLRQKCYLYNYTEDTESDNPEYHLKVTCAGMTEASHKYVNFDNFHIGSSYPGKLLPKIVPGGIVLKDVDFTIKSR